MKNVLISILVVTLLLCTGCTKQMVCTKGGEAASTKMVLTFDENEKTTSIVVTEKIDVSKQGVKEQEIDDKYLKEYRKKYTDNKDYDNVTVSSSGSLITVSYDILLDSKEAVDNYTNAKDAYKYEGFTCE